MTHDQVMSIRLALQNLEDFALQCHQRLVKYPDADRQWMLSRPDHAEVLVRQLRKTCDAAFGDVPSTPKRFRG